MEEYLRELSYDFRTTPYELPGSIADVLNQGFSQKDGTVLLTAINVQTSWPTFTDDQDRMDFEYTNNKFNTDSPEEDEELEYLKRALECGNRIANKLKEEFPGKIFKVLVFFNETNFESEHIALFAASSVRFYEVKQPDGENDLESYQGEAVLEIEVQ